MVLCHSISDSEDVIKCNFFGVKIAEIGGGGGTNGGGGTS
jgi:hypothetical protein